MADEKNPKEASNIVHNIMKASVSKPATGKQDKKEAIESFKTPGFFGKKDNVLNMSINSKKVSVVSRGARGYTIYLNNELVSYNFLKINDQWIIQKEHLFTDSELNAIGLEVDKLLQ